LQGNRRDYGDKHGKKDLLIEVDRRDG